MTIYTLPDVIPNSVATVLTATTNTLARRVYLTALGGAARFGDTNVGAARGTALPQNVPVQIAASGADASDNFDLSLCKVYAGAGVTVTISYSL